MQCNVDNCAIGDNRHLWKCAGSCNRHFHAACVGVQRHQEELLRTFMVPVCLDCQNHFVGELEIKKVLLQQQSLSEHIAQIRANHSKYLQNMHVVHESIDGLESLLTEVREEIADLNKKSGSTASSIVSHVSALFEDMTTSNCKADILEANAVLSGNLVRMIDESKVSFDEKIDQLIAHNDAGNDKSSAVEIIEELKALSVAVSNIMPAETTTSQHQHQHPSLAEELVPTEALKSGWRFLGNKKVWRRDWTEYDEKQRRRILTEAANKKTKLKRRQKKRQDERYNYYNNNFTLYNKNNRNQHYYNNHHYNENNSRNANNNNNNSNSNANNNNYCNINTNIRRNNNKLATDKEMLAVAKIQFSGHRTLSDTKFIDFRKGETLNPYPNRKTSTTTTTTSSSAASRNSPTTPTMCNSASVVTSAAAASSSSSWIDTDRRLCEQFACSQNFLLY